MANCNFCNKEIRPGTGKMFVKTDGKVLYFCSMKCEKNLIKLNRRPYSFKWARKPKKEA